MTIVVAGFDVESDILAEKLISLDPVHERAIKDSIESHACQVIASRAALKKPTKAFVYSDSLWSREEANGRMPVAETAPKIFEVPISIAAPLFDSDGSPTGRVQEHYTHSCGVAYSGSSQASHLVIETFRQEMQRLRYTWITGQSRTDAGRYAICRAGSKDDISAHSSVCDRYSDDINFDLRDLPCLTATFTAEVFHHCFTVVIRDFFVKHDKIKGHKRDFDLKLNFVLLAYCLESKRPTIYSFDWTIDTGTFPQSFKPARIEHDSMDLAVLGQLSWRDDLMAVRDHAISSGVSASGEVLRRVRELIQQNLARNYVGGSVQTGWLDNNGFTKHD